MIQGPLTVGGEKFRDRANFLRCDASELVGRHSEIA